MISRKNKDIAGILSGPLHSVTICNIAGHIEYVKEVANTGPLLPFDISALKMGLYFLKMKEKNGIVTLLKFIRSWPDRTGSKKPVKDLATEVEMYVL